MQGEVTGETESVSGCPESFFFISTYRLEFWNCDVRPVASSYLTCCEETLRPGILVCKGYLTEISFLFHIS